MKRLFPDDEEVCELQKYILAFVATYLLVKNLKLGLHQSFAMQLKCMLIKKNCTVVSTTTTRAEVCL